MHVDLCAMCLLFSCYVIRSGMHRLLLAKTLRIEFHDGLLNGCTVDVWERKHMANLRGGTLQILSVKAPRREKQIFAGINKCKILPFRYR
jgi:hypothetical protein